MAWTETSDPILLSLCGQLLKQVLTPCHIAIQASQWIRTTALSTQLKWMGTFWARSAQSQWPFSPTDLPVHPRVGAGKSKSMAILILALIELDVEHKLKILFLCKENSGTCSFADPCNGLTRQRRCLSDSQDLSVIKKGTNPAIPRRDLTSTQENKDRCSVSVNLSWLQAAQSVKISPCSGQQ